MKHPHDFPDDLLRLPGRAGIIVAVRNLAIGLIAVNVLSEHPREVTHRGFGIVRCIKEFIQLLNKSISAAQQIDKSLYVMGYKPPPIFTPEQGFK